MNSKYDKAFVMDHYKNHTSFKLTEDMIEDDSELVIGSIDVSLTPRCNLRCKDCGSLMPFYTHPKDVDIDLIIKALDRFFTVVDKVIRVNVVGGEPFLYPFLTDVVEYLNSKTNVVKVVFPTNGTIVPDKRELYEALHNPKNHVRISHYEAYNQKSEEMLERLEQENIDHSIKRFGVNEYLWYDFGSFEYRNRTEKELITQYSNCAVEWYSMYRGLLYPCPRAAHAIDLGFLKLEGNYIDLIDESISFNELKKRLQEFVYIRKYHPCCNHCDRGTGKCPVVPVAAQIDKVK